MTAEHGHGDAGKALGPPECLPPGPPDTPPGKADEDEDEDDPCSVPEPPNKPLVPVADLQALALEYEILGEEVHFLVTVDNAGKDPSGPFSIDLYVGSEIPPGTTDRGQIWIDTVESLSAGQSRSVEIVWGDGLSESVAVELPATIFAKVDSYNFVPEPDEANNVLGPFVVDASAETASLPAGTATASGGGGGSGGCFLSSARGSAWKFPPPTWVGVILLLLLFLCSSRPLVRSLE